MNETFQQVGMALGIAAVGAAFQAHVASAFTATAAGHSLGAAAAPVGRQIAAGSFAPVGAAPSPALVSAAHSAFMDGLHMSMNVCAVLCGLTLIAALSIRSRDLHPSAIGAVPGVPPEVPSEPALATN
jgi:hypothetical protein